jgi:hypothetical protein
LLKENIERISGAFGTIIVSATGSQGPAMTGTEKGLELTDTLGGRQAVLFERDLITSLDDCGSVTLPPMSALGQKQTFAVQTGMSALPPKADTNPQFAASRT